MSDPAASPPLPAGKSVTAEPAFLRTLRGIWLLTWRSQLTWNRVPLATIGLLVLPMLVFATTSDRSSAYFHWLIDFYFLILLPLNCVRLCGALIRDELQADTLGFLLTRPLTRARLVIAKYLSQTAWLQILLLIETLLVFGAGYARSIPDLGGLLPLFLIAQFFAVFAWGALGLFLGLMSKNYIALSLIYGVIVELGIGHIPTNINALSIMRHLKSLLAHNEAVQSIFDYTSGSVVFAVGAMVFASALFLALAAVSFTFREYHHTAEMQK